MAERFGANLDAATSMGQQLRDIRSDLQSLSTTMGDAAAVTGSAKVGSALEHFMKHTSDNRKHLNDLLDRAAGLLDSLVQGAESVDSSLVQALPETAAAR